MILNNNNNNPINKASFQFTDDEDDMTRLTLRHNPFPTAAAPPLHPVYHFDDMLPPPWRRHSEIQVQPPPQQHQRASRRRGGAVAALRSGKEETIPAPYPWAEPRRAAVSSLHSLVRRGVTDIGGTLQCKRCECRYEEVYDVRIMFRNLAEKIAMKKPEMKDRAPPEWLYPTLPRCRECGEENAARPVIAEKKRAINWLFLLLSGLLGCCTLEQLKYFCKHTGNHRTGAKDRVLYLAYLCLCNQLEPNELFDPHRR